MKKDILGILLVMGMFLFIAYMEGIGQSQIKEYMPKQESLRHESPYTQEVVRLENGQPRLSVNRGRTLSRRLVQLLLACLLIWEFWKPLLGFCYWQGSFLKANGQENGRVRKRRGPPVVKI